MPHTTSEVGTCPLFIIEPPANIYHPSFCDILDDIIKSRRYRHGDSQQEIWVCEASCIIHDSINVHQNETAVGLASLSLTCNTPADTHGISGFDTRTGGALVLRCWERVHKEEQDY